MKYHCSTWFDYCSVFYYKYYIKIKITFILFLYVYFFYPRLTYINGKSYLPVFRLSSVESRLPPPVHVVEVNRAVKLLFSVSSPDLSKKWGNCEELYNPKWHLSKIYRKRLKNSSRSWKKRGVKEGQFEQKFPRWVLKWLILIPTGIWNGFLYVFIFAYLFPVSIHSDRVYWTFDLNLCFRTIWAIHLNCILSIWQYDFAVRSFII